MAEKDVKTSKSSRELIGFLQSTVDELEALKIKQLSETEQRCQETIAAAEREAKAILEKTREDVAAMLSDAEEVVAAKRLEVTEWETEKDHIAKTQKFPSRIKLDIGGVKFTTSLTTLTRFPDTMIGAMFSGRHALELDDEGYFFIDRDGRHFHYILNFLRDPENYSKTEVPASFRIELKKEVAYYGLQGEMFMLPHPPTTLQCQYKENTMLTFTQDANTFLWYITCSSSFCAKGGHKEKQQQQQQQRQQQYLDSSTAAEVAVAVCCRGCGEARMTTKEGYGVGVPGFFNAERKIHSKNQPQPDLKDRKCWTCEGKRPDTGEFTAF